MQRTALALWATFLLLEPAAAQQSVPARVGDCVGTTIAGIGERLQDAGTNAPIAGSGSAITFANGLYQVSYSEIDAIGASLVGDPVLICLVQVPRNCPAGDTRGRVYTTTNLRTHDSWTLPDSEHSCGGA